VNKAELISAVAERTDTPKCVVKKIIDASLDAIQETLTIGDPVQMQGFGAFSVRAHAPRKGRNPQTGETMDIPASKSIGFKAGIGLKAAVQG